jgi:putative ABC transport system permease protein
MFKSYLKVAFRNLWRNKVFSAINIVGLSVGLATCLLILSFVRDELGYDLYNTRADRIFRVDGDIKFGGNRLVLALAPDPMGPALKKDYPEVEQYVRFRYFGVFRAKKGNENFQEDKGTYADSTLFDVFTLPMIEGDPATALVEPKSMVITETTARKYFNSTNVVGRSLIVNDTANYRITGVIRDIPSQSHFNYDFYISMSSNPESRQNTWIMNNFNTYILLKPGADPKTLESHLNPMLRAYLGPQLMQFLGTSMEAAEKSGSYDRASLMPLTKIHLRSNKVGELGPNGDIVYVYIFSATALFILLIACVNFMNLSTARSANRAREVGVRKVLGSFRSSLIAQFLTESILVSFLSLGLSQVLVSLMLGYFNHVSGKNMTFTFLSQPAMILSLIGLALGVGLLAGAYPAFYLSAFKPIKVLKGALSTGFKSSGLRSTLVVFQFSISIFLIVSTVVIYNQLQYIRTRDVGFNRQHVLILQNSGSLGMQEKAFRQEILGLKGVENVTATSYLPTGGSQFDSPLYPDPSLDQKKAILLNNWYVDENYIPTLDMHLAKGRNFSTQYPSDSSGIILNETAARLLGYPDPLNRKLYTLKVLEAGNTPDNISVYHVVGIVKDFNFNSLRQQVTPLALYLNREGNENTAIRINSKGIPTLIGRIEKVWKSMAPSLPFNYTFMDDDFNNIYKSEQRIGDIFISFAVLAIFIACLGLLGLVTYAAEQRSREIGIRKVLGASTGNIVTLMSTDFLKLVVISALIAFPLSWWAMNRWLQDFAYRVGIGWWVFALSGMLAIAIALGTVSFEAIKAALANPVKSLRSE